jgi:uncharacterized membrane protein
MAKFCTMKKFLGYFLQGLILFIPLVITAFILFKLFDLFSGPFSIIGVSDFPLINTLLGLAASVLFIWLLGLLASSYIFKQIFDFFEDKLEHAPFVRHIYSPVKDFTNAFVGNKKKFSKPVLVLTNASANIEEIGFITQEDLSDFNIKGKVAVYLPLSYSLSGRLLIVPVENVKPLDAHGSDAMKFVVSGGVADKD